MSAFQTVSDLCADSFDEEFVGQLIATSFMQKRITKEQADQLGYENGLDWESWLN